MLWNSDALNAVNTLFFWSVVGLNVFGLMVTQVLGSVFRAVMLTARTASVSHHSHVPNYGTAGMDPPECFPHVGEW